MSVSLSVFQDDAEETKTSGVERVQARAQRPVSVPEQSPSARSLASGSLEEEEATVSNKELEEWLRQHPTYTMDMAGYTPVCHPLILSQFMFPIILQVCLSKPSVLNKPLFSDLIHRRARSQCCLPFQSPNRSAIAVETPTRLTSTP